MASGRVFLAALVVSALAVSLLAGCGGSVAAPTSYDDYNSKDGSFACKYPAGWDSQGGGRGGVASAVFKKGGAKIKITADFAGSVIGDIAGSGMGGMVPGMDLSAEELEALAPVAKVHAMGKEAMAEEFGDFEEQPPEAIDTVFGSARKAEFTGKTSFGGALHGYRVTALSNKRRITIVAHCPEDNWETLKPAFNKVIESLTIGQAMP